MIVSAVPKLPFRDKEKTVAYYVDGLGFSLLSDYGDYLILKMDSAEIHFFSYPELEPVRSHFMVYLRVDNIDEFYRRLTDRAVEIHPNGSLTTKPWGQKEFSLLDPDNTLLTFGQAV